VQIRDFLTTMPSYIDQYEGLLTGNPIWMNRLKGVGYLSPKTRIALGVTGPPLRASGVDFDLRRDMPYSGYEKFQFKVPVSECGRRVGAVRRPHEEMRESVKICQQALDGLPEGRIVADAPKIILPDREQMKTQMESLIHHFKIVTEGFAVPAGRSFRRRSLRAGDGLLRRFRRHGQAVSGAHAQPVLRDPAGAGDDVQGTVARGRGGRNRVDRYRAGEIDR
jgi:NADH-quinone oxidoreductase subunit D